MRSPRVWLHYRPVRVGWIVSGRDVSQLRAAAEYSTCLWGGRFNPIIPADDLPLARNLIRAFHVDLLWPMEQSAEAVALTTEFAHLVPGMWGRAVFDPARDHGGARIVDVMHAATLINERAATLSMEESGVPIRPIVAGDDPLYTPLTMILGAYPSSAVTGFDYAQELDRVFFGRALLLDSRAALPAEIFDAWTPIRLTTYGFRRTWAESWRAPGLVVGNAASFDDLLLLWNLRAADAPVWFYDQAHENRLIQQTALFLDTWRRAEVRRRRQFNLWGYLEDIPRNLDLSGFEVARCGAQRRELWNGLNIEVPMPRFTDWHRDVVATSVETERGPSTTFPLPDQPFNEQLRFHRRQHFVVSVSASEYAGPADDFTFAVPPLPELNEFYGRNYYFDYSAARAEMDRLDRGCVGIVTTVGTQRLTVYAVSVPALIKQFFDLCQIGVERSEAGLICSRLVRQLGGAQGCRVLKVRGARNLIRRYNADQSFTRSAALQIIRDHDPASNRVGFDQFKDLVIERREATDLKPEDVFNYLVSRGVFRVGLTLQCPNCMLRAWVHIDDVRTELPCGYCGFRFDVTPQLRDRGDWRYRRSGLFGRPDDQQGAVPVALTLQQLDTTLHDSALVYSTGLNLLPRRADVETCELDFFLMVTQRRPGSTKLVQVVFGECKTEGVINAEDVRKLGKVADAIASGPADPYILFAKTGTFTPEEIELARSLNGEYQQRVILWSVDELEPYFVYERARERLGDRQYAVSLDDMAVATHILFFEA